MNIWEAKTIKAIEESLNTAEDEITRATDDIIRARRMVNRLKEELEQNTTKPPAPDYPPGTQYPCPAGGDCKSPECQGNGWHIASPDPAAARRVLQTDPLEELIKLAEDKATNVVKLPEDWEYTTEQAARILGLSTWALLDGIHREDSPWPHINKGKKNYRFLWSHIQHIKAEIEATR